MDIICSMKAFGQKLLKIRKEKKLSQHEVAEALGVHAPAIGRYERDEIRPSLEMLKKLADFYDVSTDYLLSDVDTAIKDKAMVKRITELDSLGDSDKLIVTSALDAMIRDAKARRTYS